MLYDLHSHLLPGVDDGAPDDETSMELAQLAVSEGIRHLVLTPHHYNNQYVNHKEDVIEATERLNRLYQKAGIDLLVYPSQEIRIQRDLVDNILYRDDYLSLDAQGKYYLIEMPTKSVPDYALELCKALLAQGMTPVIAHPERNHSFAANIRTLYPFIEAGCLAQLTSHSYIGFYGDKLRQISQEMIEHNLIHIIASDAHHIKHRPFNLAAAYRQVEKDYSRELSLYYQRNAQAIFQGQSFKTMRPKLKKRFGLF
ncbi:TPA: tyrosine-protein phosphatase [Streptococcus suis]